MGNHDLKTETPFKWFYVDSSANESSVVRQHAYQDDGQGGNISLCNRRIVGEDWVCDKFETIPSEEMEINNHCKICKKITEKLCI